MPIDGIRSGSGGVRRKNPLAGFPDFAGISPKGRFFALEIKGPTDRLSEKQSVWIRDLAASNAIVGVVDSYDSAVDFVSRIVQN